MKSEKDIVFHLARLALAGKAAEVAALIRRTASRAAKTDPEYAGKLRRLLAAEGASAVRKATHVAIPTDADTRLHLVRQEYPVVLTGEPVWPDLVAQVLTEVVQEREKQEELIEAGLFPSRSMLFTGPPGVGKTLAARWLAERLGAPLFVLDLAAVMSSYLGRTGSNLRAVLNYTRDQGCVLLLDEFDAIAKRRDDLSEIGELKRLVTVLLQAIDDWPPTGLLIAATNHPGLLDPAVWRRFEQVVQFPMPSTDQVRLYLNQHLGDESGSDWAEVLTGVLAGSSFAELEHIVNRLRRASIVSGRALEHHILTLVESQVEELAKSQRIELGVRLIGLGQSQRRAHEITGVSRDTLRRHCQRSGS